MKKKTRTGREYEDWRESGREKRTALSSTQCVEYANAAANSGGALARKQDTLIEKDTTTTISREVFVTIA